MQEERLFLNKGSEEGPRGNIWEEIWIKRVNEKKSEGKE